MVNAVSLKAIWNMWFSQAGYMDGSSIAEDRPNKKKKVGKRRGLSTFF